VGRGVVVREHDECRQKRVIGHAGAFKCSCSLFVLQIGARVRTCRCHACVCVLYWSVLLYILTKLRVNTPTSSRPMWCVSVLVYVSYAPGISIHTISRIDAIHGFHSSARKHMQCMLGAVSLGVTYCRRTQEDTG